MLIHFLLAQIGHDAGLPIGCPLDSISNDPVQIGIHCSLVHLHDFFVKTLLSCPDDILSIPTASFLDLSVPPFVLSFFNLFFDLLLLGDPNQLL
jgi:hypothetical protein